MAAVIHLKTYIKYHNFFYSKIQAYFSLFFSKIVCFSDFIGFYQIIRYNEHD